MPSTCPNCSKALSAAAGAVFCMYCGHRLRPDGDTPSGSEPDPADTSDMLTRAHVPADATPEEFPDTPPERVGSYRLVRALGTGGMGTVFEAEADDTGERVAVKLLSPKLSANPLSVERFKQEGRLASQLSHPRCVFVYGADTDAGRPFIVMELMPGTTLKDLVDRRGPLPVGEAVARVLDAIDGLIEAHRLGVIHRDVKPSNCFLTADDRVKVGDFGLSKSLAGSHGDKQLTTTGAFLGTVLFASPEQIRGEEVGYDSDVYSVAATLYYLLAGQAPYQHESLTAALAKAISEPPPRLRAKRPDVPRTLERIVLRGLERDRGRRWDTLEEFRDALTEMLPAQLRPAHPRLMIAAYLIDVILLLILVQFPLAVLDALFGGWRGLRIVLETGFDPLALLVYVAYFGAAEGVYGTTVGKWLLRLRVTRVGQVGPPGVWPATVRALVFNALWLAAFNIPVVVWDVAYVGPVLAVGVFAAAVCGLCQQLRPSRGYRGLHDRAAGTQVVQRPRPAHRVRLHARGVNPLDRVKKSAPALPPVVGGYAVRGKLLDLPNGAVVWAAEDRSLGRRVLLWVRPAHMAPPEAHPADVRPTRLRAVGSGDVLWDGAVFWWVAFVAPAGAALPDVVDPARPLPWCDARQVLEQVVDELLAADADGTLPGRLGVDQVWVEPSGRVHLLDFPVPTAAAPPPASNPLGLVRQVTTLLLEGAARESGGPVQAPLPPHASRFTDRLFAPADSFRDVRAVHAALAESHAHPPRVTPGMRAAQIGLTGTLAGTGLAAMLLAVLGYPLWAASFAVQQVNAGRVVLAGLRDPGVRQQWAADPENRPHLAPDRLAATDRRFDAYVALQREELAAQKRRLTRPERYLVERLERVEVGPAMAAALPPDAVRSFFGMVDAYADREELVPSQQAAIQNLIGIILLLFLASYMVFAAAFRGGLSYLLTGLAIVRRDGRRAGRLRCAARDLFGWLPLIAALGVAVWVQAAWPDWGVGRLFAAVTTAGVLLAGIVIAIRFPERGPHDRVVGTYVVPA